jgi:NAD(P)-dependent dehydrogenase (short-subunit alcohol dehydrogenase family)
MSTAEPDAAMSRKVLVVGGARGIGREVCRMLAADGCRLIVADRDEAALGQLRDELPGEPALLTMDLALPGSVAAAVAHFATEAAALDVVVISAAVHAAHPAEYLSDALIDSVIDVNLIAHIKLVRDLLPLIADGGRIIGLSSNCASIGIPMEAVYAASKAGLERFYEALSIEIAYRGIRPIVIQPGNVNTGFNETGNTYSARGNAFVDDAYQRVVTAIDSSKGMPPATVARTIVDAIRARRPRFRYIVGINALKAHWVKRLLGTGLALQLMARYFGIRPHR